MKSSKVVVFFALVAALQYAPFALSSGSGEDGAKASDWTGETPEALFEALATNRSQETKTALADYIRFKLSQTLPALDLELVEVKATSFSEDRDISVTVKNASGSNREFTFKMGRKVAESFEAQGQIIIGICLNIVKCIMNHELLQKNVRTWHFRLNDDLLPEEAILVYENIKINIANDKFFRTFDGKTIFDGSRVVAAIHQEAKRMRDTEYVCPITIESILPSEDACYLDAETAGDGSRTYYTKEALTTWVSAHGTGPISRFSVSLADIKSIKVPPRDILLGLPPFAKTDDLPRLPPGQRYYSLPVPQGLSAFPTVGRQLSLKFVGSSLQVMSSTLGQPNQVAAAVAVVEAAVAPLNSAPLNSGPFSNPPGAPQLASGEEDDDSSSNEEESDSASRPPKNKRSRKKK
jgi:hypothetical protein